MGIQVNGPLGRYDHAMTYDLDRAVTILAGGNPFYHSALDVWEYDGSIWRPAPSLPEGISATSMVYDESRGVTVITTPSPYEFANCLVDADGDGMLDHLDACLESDTSETITIGDCDTGVANVLDRNGCTPSDAIHACDSEENHGAFIRCVKEIAREWLDEGLISRQESMAIRRCAAHRP